MKGIGLFAVLMVGLSSFAFAGGTAPGGGTSAPEVDMNLAAGTLVVIGGAVLLIRSRLRR